MSIEGVPTGTETMAEARREMWLWAEPVIIDCASDAYNRRLANRLAAEILAKKHGRLWQAVIHDQIETVPALAEDLARNSAKFGVERDLQHEVNNLLVEELVDIILTRFRASRRAAKACSMVLMSASSVLGARRVAA